MTAAFEFVELDVKTCSLTFGSGACRARLGYAGANGPVMAEFSGSQETVRGAGLTGAADSKELAFAGLVYIDAIGSVQYLAAGATSVGGTTLRFSLEITAAGRLRVFAADASGTTVLDIASSVLAADTHYHFAGSVDLTDTGNRHLYIDGVSDLDQVTTYTNTAMDFTLSDWSVGAKPDGSTGPFSGLLGLLWIDLGNYLDLSDADNLAKFIASGRPVDLGANGATPTGTQPIMFFDGEASAWGDNLGSGGDFTLSGTLGQIRLLPNKCFNALAREDTTGACVDRDNFTPADPAVTHRFVRPTASRDRSIEALPYLDDVEITPGRISLGGDLGVRTQVRARFTDHRHPDRGAGFDQYGSDRSYTAYDQGTFWGRFRARQPFLVGQPFRRIIGYDDQAIGAMATDAFVVDAFTGPDAEGRFEIVAKDILKLADADRAQAPALSNGYLQSAINSSVTSATLAPSGIGSEYPASGHLNIGGQEIVAFTRSSDTLTLTRGQLGTTAASHASEDRCQLVLVYTSEDPSAILEDLLTTYAGISASYIPSDDWDEETTTYFAQLFTATIAEPTAVSQLVSEIIEQAGLAMWWDARDQEIKLRVVKALTGATVFGASQMLAGSLTVREQPDRRMSSVWTYYDRANPLLPLTDLDNYRATAVTDAPNAGEYTVESIKKIFSRWIPSGGRQVAIKLNALLLSRFAYPPRRFAFQLMADPDEPDQVELGLGYLLQGQPMQEADGSASSVPVQVTRIAPHRDVIEVEAEEVVFEEVDEASLARAIYIETDTANFNLRSAYDLLYPAPNASTELTCYVQTGVTVYSTTVFSYAFETGAWPAGASITIINRGAIVGRGGHGGQGGDDNGAGHPVSDPGDAGGGGGPALNVSVPIDLDNGSGLIGGGGGGGGGGGRGGVSATGGVRFAGPGGGGGGGAGRSFASAGGSGASGSYLGQSSTPGGAGAAGTQTAGGAGGAGGLQSGHPGGSCGPGGAGGAGGGLGASGSAGSNGTQSTDAVAGTAGGAGGGGGTAIQGWSNVTVLPGGTGTISGATSG